MSKDMSQRKTYYLLRRPSIALISITAEPSTAKVWLQSLRVEGSNDFVGIWGEKRCNFPDDFWLGHWRKRHNWFQGMAAPDDVPCESAWIKSQHQQNLQPLRRWKNWIYLSQKSSKSRFGTGRTGKRWRTWLAHQACRSWWWRLGLSLVILYNHDKGCRSVINMDMCDCLLLSMHSYLFRCLFGLLILAKALHFPHELLVKSIIVWKFIDDFILVACVFSIRIIA